MKINGKEDVREIALDIIAYEGIDNLTMSHLAASLGITKATLYHYYKSKEELIEDIHRSGHLALMHNGFKLSLDGSAEEVLLSATGPWMKLFTSEKTVPYLKMIFSLRFTEERSYDEYRSLSLMLFSQAEVIIGAIAKSKVANERLYVSLFSSLLLTNLEKILLEEEADLEGDIRAFSNLLEEKKASSYH